MTASYRSRNPGHHKMASGESPLPTEGLSVATVYQEKN
jgi:hypothetical protein